MNYLKAMDDRLSRRVYTSEPISNSIVRQIEERVTFYQKQTDIRIEAMHDASDTFTSIELDYGFFQNVDHILAFFGKKEDSFSREKAGYFGELLMLELVEMGFGTCWIGGTYNPESKIFDVSDEEELICIISYGYSPNSMTEMEATKRKNRRDMDKSMEEFYQASEVAPKWFLDGVASVRRGPSSMNKQPVKFQYEDGEAVIYVDPYEGPSRTDLGIAKAHFELVADGKFPMGNYAKFERR